MDALRQAFEAQFGTEWSAPVVKPAEDPDVDSEPSEITDAGEEEFAGFESEEQEGLVTVKHSEGGSTEPEMTKRSRRKFMSSGAPRDDTVLSEETQKEEQSNLNDDLALQRMISESHILHERPKGQEFSGADISGAQDPLENAGKLRLKILEHRLGQAGGGQRGQRMPQAMAVGIKKKSASRKQKTKEEARDAGIILAKERFAKSKNRVRDKGLKINAIGKASEHGIYVSPAEIARMTSRRGGASRGRGRGGKFRR